MRNRLVFAVSIASTAVLASWLDLPRRSRGSVVQDLVIGQLIGRNQQITITAAVGGARYSVQRDGRIVAENLTLEQLRRQDPQSCRQVESATADHASGKWAGIE